MQKQNQRSRIPIFWGAKPHCLGERLNGIQEVSGSIPLISTRKTLKTIGFQGFFLFSGNFSCGGGNFLTQV